MQEALEMTQEQMDRYDLKFAHNSEQTKYLFAFRILNLHIDSKTNSNIFFSPTYQGAYNN